jgi:hypothetical protein
MSEAKKETCLDCLHCKVSAKSTAHVRLCYCVKAGKGIQRQEPYWSERKVCGAFDSMGPCIATPRSPLLKGTNFLGGQGLKIRVHADF